MTTKTKVVKYDAQGIIRAAAKYAPFLLTVDDELVQKFFTAMAVEQEDGALVLPESIRSFFAVEVVYEDLKPVPMIDADFFAAIPSIYDSPIDESKYEPATEAEALRHNPTWDKAFTGNSLMFSDDVGEFEPVDATGEGNDSGEFELSELEDIPF